MLQSDSVNEISTTLARQGVQGLAYSVSGGWNTTPADHVGTFVAGGETAKPVEFLAALQRVLQVSTQIMREPYTTQWQTVNDVCYCTRTCMCCSIINAAWLFTLPWGL